MIDQSTAKGRIVAAALREAARRPWREVTLADIAQGAGLNLAELRREVSGKSDITAAFARMIDDEVLARAPRRSEGQAARDAVFDVVMVRFDALVPHKDALKSIAADASADPALLPGFLASQAWMLNAAGVSTDGIEGNARVMGLASIYASVFRTWLEDDDVGMARTMAALDRRLRRGESTIQTVDGVLGAARRVVGMVTGRTGRGKSPGGTSESQPAADDFTGTSRPT